LTALQRELGHANAMRSVTALLALAAHGPELPQQVFTELIGMSGAESASQLLRRLRESGLIDQAIAPEHRSHRLLSLTPKAVEMLRRAGVAV
jgi:DNA-binding MarR family transcriptional regulator